MAFSHTNSKGVVYYLHANEVVARQGDTRKFHFFAQTIRDNAIDTLPDGFRIVENARTGLPMLKRIV